MTRRTGADYDKTERIPQIKDGYYRLDLPPNFNALMGYAFNRPMNMKKLEYNIEIIKPK